MQSHSEKQSIHATFADQPNTWGKPNLQILLKAKETQEYIVNTGPKVGERDKFRVKISCLKEFAVE